MLKPNAHRSNGEKHINSVAIVAIAMLLGSLYCLNFGTMKIGTVLLYLGWVYYGMLKGLPLSNQ